MNKFFNLQHRSRQRTACRIMSRNFSCRFGL